MPTYSEQRETPDQIASSLIKCGHSSDCLTHVTKEYRALFAHKKMAKLISKYGGALDDPSAFGIVGAGAEVLYLAIRLLRPAIIVETGVSAGYSTAYILAALDRNDHGELISIDYPYHEGEAGPYPKFKSFLPVGLESGWLVPESLRSRWTLHIGKSTELLQNILATAGMVDMFFHDSEHTEVNMLWEFNVAWQRLRSGGVLMADDVNMPHVGRREAGNPFGRFVSSKKRKGFFCGRMGWLIK